MAKPEPFELNYLVKLHKEEFVKFELWLSDELTNHIIRAKDLDPAYTSVVVDLDEDEPLNDKGQLRLNGRFYIPTKDKKGVDLNTQPSDWVDITKEWFDDNDVEVTIEEDPSDLVKFTVFMDGINLPSGGGEVDEGEESMDEGAEEGAPPEEDMEDDFGEEAPEEIEEAPEEDFSEDAGRPPGDDEQDLKDFEKSLGL